MPTIGSNYKVPTESSVLAASGTGITLTAGHGYIAAVNYADAASINEGVATDPGTDFLDLSSGPGAVTIGDASSNDWITVYWGAAETSGHTLRVKVTVDGTDIVDFTITSNGADVIENGWYPLLSEEGGVSAPIEYNDTFVINITRSGTCDDDSSEVRIGAIRYDVH